MYIFFLNFNTHFQLYLIYNIKLIYNNFAQYSHLMILHLFIPLKYYSTFQILFFFTLPTLFNFEPSRRQGKLARLV